MLLIAEENHEDIGVFRLDLRKKSENEVSIYLNPKYIGKGYGKRILDMGCDWVKNEFLQVDFLKATILEHNVASKKIFEDCEFNKEYSVYKLDLSGKK